MKRQVMAGVFIAMTATAFVMLGGCDQQEKERAASPSVSSPSSSIEELYDCTDFDNNHPLKQSWCEATELSARNHGFQAHSDQFKQYLTGYRQGIHDASQAQASRISRSGNGVDLSPEDSGYQQGYEKIVKQMGIVEFNNTITTTGSEYSDRWYEAADNFSQTGLNENNPFLKSRFIDGYMTGGRIALTVPSSMESFLNGDAPATEQPVVIQPEQLNNMQQAFYQGFDEGYQAMVASIRASISQVMEQMESSDMPLPEGMGAVEPNEN